MGTFLYCPALYFQQPSEVGTFTGGLAKVRWAHSQRQAHDFHSLLDLGTESPSAAPF